MCPPNRIVLNVASEIVEGLKQQDNKKIEEILAKYSKKYILYFKTIEQVRVYKSTLIGVTQIWLRWKTIELNNDICADWEIYMKKYGLNDENTYYFCMFLKKGAKMDLSSWKKKNFTDVKHVEKKNLKVKREK